MWPVWNTTRMQRDRRTFNASTAAKVAIDIVDHLIAIDVAMIIWHWDREWMIIQFRRYKGTDYEVWPLEGLMYWRRLVDAPGDGLKVANIEDPGILAAIPAHGINGMEVKPVTRDHVGHLDTDLVIASFDVRYKLFRPANVAFAVVGVLQHLSVLIEITARVLRTAMGLDSYQALYVIDSRWSIVIVKIRLVLRKAIGREVLLGVESSVWFAELCMTLRGYLPQTMISWHSALLIRRFDSAIRQSLQFPIRLRHHAGTRGEPRYPTQAGSPFRQCRNRARLQHEGGHCAKPGRSSVESCSISG